MDSLSNVHCPLTSVIFASMIPIVLSIIYSSERGRYLFLYFSETQQSPASPGSQALDEQHLQGLEKKIDVSERICCCVFKVII